MTNAQYSMLNEPARLGRKFPPLLARTPFKTATMRLPGANFLQPQCGRKRRGAIASRRSPRRWRVDDDLRIREASWSAPALWRFCPQPRFRPKMNLRGRGGLPTAYQLQKNNQRPHCRGEQHPGHRADGDVQRLVGPCRRGTGNSPFNDLNIGNVAGFQCIGNSGVFEFIQFLTLLLKQSGTFRQIMFCLPIGLFLWRFWFGCIWADIELIL